MTSTGGPVDGPEPEERQTPPQVVLVTYSTRPRGGVVHTLYLAEALHRLGERVHVVALGEPEAGFFRPTVVPHTIIPAPPPAPALAERVFRSVDALAEGLVALPPAFRILHAQDCIAARAATRARDLGAPTMVVRTVHHVDDFTTQALVECQRRAIREPDHVLVVSDWWRRALEVEYGVVAEVVRNGVDAERFAQAPRFDPGRLRARVGAKGRFLFLTVGGIEPRKGAAELIGAMALLRRSLRPSPVLAVVGGHSFQDYAAYRDRVLTLAQASGLELGRDVVLLGTIPDGELPSWYHAADAFVFPSLKEGWGLVVLEAMAAGLPVITTDIPVFREYLVGGRDALLVAPGDVPALAEAMRAMATDRALRARLRAAGSQVATRFRWEDSAYQHRAIYARLADQWAAWQFAC
jgi:glycosyltransferase-like protein